MLRLALLGALAASAVACADSTLAIDNNSSFAFQEINLAAINNPTFGRNLLGSDILLPGETIQISGIACDTYDIRVVTDAGHECILDNVDICLDNAKWVIDNTELAICSF